jgi:CTP:molybdopterin cytidylyltransferase MocA
MSDACVILAAGRGERLGGVAKALLRHRGRSFLEAISASCRAAGAEEIVVVVAEPHRDETVAEAERLALPWVDNPTPEEGMASSVSVGFDHARRHMDAELCWLWPVDTPGPSAALLQRLREQGERGRVVVPEHRGRGGHPILVGRELWAELASCRDLAQGARTVLRRDPARVRRVPVEEPLVLADVDRPADMEALR